MTELDVVHYHHHHHQRHRRCLPRRSSASSRKSARCKRQRRSPSPAPLSTQKQARSVVFTAHCAGKLIAVAGTPPNKKVPHARRAKQCVPPPCEPAHSDRLTFAPGLRLADTVVIRNCRPLSARKRFTLERIVKSPETERDEMHRRQAEEAQAQAA